MSRLRLRILEAARRDLFDIKTWLTQPGSGHHAWAHYAAVTHAVLDLRSGCHRWPTGDHAGTRERLVEGYRIDYRVNDKQSRVEILRVSAPAKPGDSRSPRGWPYPPPFRL